MSGRKRNDPGLRRRDDLNAWARAYYAKNREKRLAYQKQWHAKNADRLREQRKTQPSRYKPLDPKDAPPTKAGLPNRRWGSRWGVHTNARKEWSAAYERLPETKARRKAIRDARGTKPRPGWTRELRARMLIDQMGRCAICARLFDETRKPNQDHDALTLKARGLLCLNCNHLIGKSKDDPAILASAIAYLKRYDQ